MYPIHENETGLFQELAHKTDVIFGQISLLVIKPGCYRGNHYHKRKQEWFCCLHGKCSMELKNVQTKRKKRIILDSERRKFIKVNPFEIHILRNLDNSSDCELLIIVSEEYNPDDPDTFKGEKF